MDEQTDGQRDRQTGGGEIQRDRQMDGLSDRQRQKWAVEINTI